MHDILAVSGKGPDWWLTNHFTEQDCNLEIKALKRVLHGRRRSEYRRNWRKHTAWLEQQREKRKTGRIIKAILQTLAGRKHQNGVNLETVQDSNTTHVTPETVHTAATVHFKEWYAMPDHLMDTLHSIDDWRPHLQNYDDFRASYPNSKVPDHLMRQIFVAMQDVDNAQTVRSQLTEELSAPPTYDEFEKKLRNLKGYSSPGPSGLSYNMLKKAPDTAVKELYKCLKQMWVNKEYQLHGNGGG